LKLRPAVQIAGAINIIVALAMIFPLAVSLIYGDGDSKVFLYSILVSAFAGLVMFLGFKTPGHEINHREGFVIVSFSWISGAFFCAIPFIFSGLFGSFVDCIFESVSGMTTTGASILTDIEALPHGILFWRSMIHWLGGVGIVLFSLAILPLLGVGGMQLYKAEASVVGADRFASRVKEMARIILIVYLLFSVVLTVLLKLSGMSLFDSLIHMFGTVSTGGFSSHGTSVAYFDSAYIETIITVFMILGATNFALHYNFFKQGFKVYTKNAEFRFYIFLMAAATVAVTINLSGGAGGIASLAESFRYSAFQVVSIITTTGYGSADFDAWPPLSRFIILALMFAGGSAGSTTGSIKCIRLVLLLKLGYKEIYRLIHPHAVIPVKLSGRVVPREVLRGVMGFTILYLIVFLVSSFILAALGIDLVSSIASAAATLANVGPGLGLTGPLSSYAMIPDLGKWVLILNMLLGRLEIYTLLILFVPAYWRG
jgi:trk system potassium uptake protein TrkH